VHAPTEVPPFFDTDGLVAECFGCHAKALQANEAIKEIFSAVESVKAKIPVPSQKPYIYDYPFAYCNCILYSFSVQILSRDIGQASELAQLWMHRDPAANILYEAKWIT